MNIIFKINLNIKFKISYFFRNFSIFFKLFFFGEGKSTLILN